MFLSNINTTFYIDDSLIIFLFKVPLTLERYFLISPYVESQLFINISIYMIILIGIQILFICLYTLYRIKYIHVEVSFPCQYLKKKKNRDLFIDDKADRKRMYRFYPKRRTKATNFESNTKLL